MLHSSDSSGWWFAPALITSLIPTTTDKEAPRRNCVTEWKRTKAHPGSRAGFRHRARPPGPAGQERPARRTADKLLDQRAEAGDGRIDVALRGAAAEPPAVACRLVEIISEGSRRLREPDAPDLGDLHAEVELMVIYVLAEPAQAGHDDGHLSPGPRARDRCRTAVADDQVRPVQQRVELTGAQEA